MSRCQAPDVSAPLGNRDLAIAMSLEDTSRCQVPGRVPWGQAGEVRYAVRRRSVAAPRASASTMQPQTTPTSAAKRASSVFAAVRASAS
jgi:hypothetical protein